MILIFTIVFLMFSVRYLVKGQSFYDSLKELSTLGLKYEQETNQDFKKDLSIEILCKAILPLICAITVIISKIVYLGNVYYLDIYKWPTLVMILWIFMGLIVGFAKKKKRVTEEDFRAAQYEIDTMPKRKFKDVIYSIVSIVYFGYILWILMGGN